MKATNLELKFTKQRLEEKVYLTKRENIMLNRINKALKVFTK